MYCGRPTKRGRKGEHIVPEAIGGGRTLNDLKGDAVTDRVVCPDCNSGILSTLDRELCSRSFLSAVASQHLGAEIWQTWDVDHSARNLLVEAKPVWAGDGELLGLSCYPQITFEREGAVARGDYLEFMRFGREDFTPVLYKAARNCFGRYRSGEQRAIHFERVRSDVIHSGYRLPPRLYAPRTIDAVAANSRSQSFVLRFDTEADKHFALEKLQTIGDGRSLRSQSGTAGSHHPTISFFFDVGDTVRALVKLGLNLVAAYCPNTPVNRDAFPWAIRTVMVHEELPRRVLKANGFVPASDVQSIRAENNAHSFRLAHDGESWHVVSSFFGGKIGTYALIPGPNREAWCCADIVAPLHSKVWEVRTSRIFQAMRVRVGWRNENILTPTFKLQNVQSSVDVEEVRRRTSRI
jgi:hypothetical protein